MASYPIARGYGTGTGDTGLILRGFSIGSNPAHPLTLITRGFLGRGSSLIKRGFSSYIGLPEPPITGKQYQNVQSLTYVGYSLLMANTGALLNDVFVTDVADNNGYPITVNTDGTGYIAANGALTTQTFTSDVFDVASQGNLGSSLIVINNGGPQILTPLPAQFNYALGTLIALDFVNGTPQYVISPTGAALTMTLTSGQLPPGTSIIGTEVYGFTTTAGSYSSLLTFTDPVGGTLAVPVTFYIYGIITMPNLVGLTQAAAIATIQSLGLSYGGTGGGTFSNTIPAGSVTGQSLPAGANPPFGTLIELTLSLGPQSYGGPNITQWQALAILANAGFVPYPVIAYVYSSTVPDYYVVAQSIAPGSLITSSTGVQLTVSMGPPNPTVTSTIPNVVGMSITQAMQTLVAAQCGVGTISWQLSNTAPSTVLSQSPTAGGPVAEWTDVSLVFSSGPSITYPNTGTLTVPNVVT